MPKASAVFGTGVTNAQPVTGASQPVAGSAQRINPITGLPM